MAAAAETPAAAACAAAAEIQPDYTDVVYLSSNCFLWRVFNNILITYMMFTKAIQLRY